MKYNATSCQSGDCGRENGVAGRKRTFINYRNRFVTWLEGTLLKDVEFARDRRRGLYRFFGVRPIVREREYPKDDLTCPCLVDVVEQTYWRMDAFAAEFQEVAEEKYDRVIFISDNGAARKHHNRPTYSINVPEGISENNLRDFYGHILRWIAAEPNPGVVHE